MLSIYQMIITSKVTQLSMLHVWGRTTKAPGCRKSWVQVLFSQIYGVTQRQLAAFLHPDMVSDDYNKLHVVVNQFSLHRESCVRCRKRDCATCARANNLHNAGRKIALRLSFSVAMSRMNASTRGLRPWLLLRAGTARSTLTTSTVVRHCGRHLHTKQSQYHMTQSVPKQSRHHGGLPLYLNTIVCINLEICCSQGSNTPTLVHS